jgi:hypothetical protein
MISCYICSIRLRSPAPGTFHTRISFAAMEYLSTICPKLFVLCTLILSQTRAQTRLDNGANSTECIGHSAFRSSSSVNATGQRPFTFSGFDIPHTYYLSTTLNDTRHSPASGSAVHWVQGYISVPQNIDASICVYQFSGIDAVQEDEYDGCRGVLSQECLVFLQNSISYPDSGSQDCPEPPTAGDGETVCPAMMFNGGTVFYRKKISG